MNSIVLYNKTINITWVIIIINNNDDDEGIEIKNKRQ